MPSVKRLLLSGMNCHSTFGPPTHSVVSETFFGHTTTDSLSNIDHVTVRLPRFNVHTLTYGASSKTFNNNNNEGMTIRKAYCMIHRLPDAVVLTNKMLYFDKI